jgi:NADPH-dependent curcumin reductase CurA
MAAAWPLLKVNARVPLCGLIAYSSLKGPPAGPDQAPVLLRQMLVKRLKVQGFIIFDHFDRYAEFVRDMSGWLAQGKLQYREEVLEGLELAPAGLIGMLRGDNFGKLIVKVAD